MDARLKLAMNLRRLRVARGWSQERLAADSGVDRTYVGAIERQSENPTIEVLDRFAGALGVAVHELLTPITNSPDEPPRLRAGRKPKT